MPEHSADELFLQRALNLARQGIGLASPNPYVGGVIVDAHGSIVGRATYAYGGVKHAEVLALQEAGDKARGATLYINLEPHAHQGRTPPCTDALIAAGIHRVVASMSDPNPRVSGRGFEQLRAAGIKVEVGGLQAEARQLNEAFARYIRHGVPLVTLKAAMTLDGKIAPAPSTTSQRLPGTPPGGWITGDAARAHVHVQRHESDAILVGVGTILADDPLLTDRSGKARRRPLLRVILDSKLRLPLQSRLVQSVANGEYDSDILVFFSAGNERKKNELQARGIRVEQLPPDSNDRPDMHVVLRRLGQLEITSLMIEGGSAVNRQALASGIVDKLFFYYAPQIMGDAKAIRFAETSFGDKTQRFSTHRSRLYRFEDDIAIESYLRDPYGDDACED
ncbi:MAG: bifunctional diaminohydroxyphosphoribosylaminopyrimidine deaminase/5-amino-6-(5-phosphoribosylamino)uracil reductase RibD [Candidatus Sulfotelmatobacter sp.]